MQSLAVLANMLFGVVLGLSGFFQTREEGKAVTDDFVFRLFYGFTCGVLFLATALVGMQDLVGKSLRMPMFHSFVRLSSPLLMPS